MGLSSTGTRERTQATAGLPTDVHTCTYVAGKGGLGLCYVTRLELRLLLDEGASSYRKRKEFISRTRASFMIDSLLTRS